MEGSGPEKIKIQIRQSSGANFHVEIEKDATIKALKDACVAESTIPAAEQRLIFKGKILKDEQTLVDYKIENEVTVHLVKSAKPPSQS